MSAPRRRLPVFWLVLSAVVVIVPSYFSIRSPGGSWGNLIFGYGFTMEADPGSFYVISAHEFVNDLGRPLFIGHPGIPLQAILFGVQWTLFHLMAPAHQSFSEFVARHLPETYAASKVVMSVVSAASLPVIFALARGLGLTTFGAMAATLAYATCFPFLFYVSRISVESSAVLFAFGSCVCLFKAEDAWVGNERRAALFWLAGCGAACGLALLSKMNQTAILLVLLPLAIVTSRRLGRAAGALSFTAGLAAIFLASMPVMEWGYFLGTWATPAISPTVDASQTASILKIGAKLWSVFGDLSGSLGKLSLRPQVGFNGMFNLLESSFVIVSIISGVAFVKRHGWSRRHLLVVAFVLWTVFLWWYRGTTVFLLSFHYLFFFMVLLAVWFGDAVDGIVARLDTTGTRSRAGWLAIAVVLAHGQSMWGFLDTRMSDVHYYRGFSKPLFDLQAQLKPGARAAILTTAAEQQHVQSFYGLDFSYVVGKPSNIQAALPMTPLAVTGLEPSVIEERLREYQYVVDLTAGEATLTTGAVPLQTVADWAAAHRSSDATVSTLKEK